MGVVQGPLNCCAEAEVQAENLHPEKVEEIERGKRKKDIKRVPITCGGEWWRMESVARIMDDWNMFKRVWFGLGC